MLFIVYLQISGLRTVVLVMKKYASDITFENQTMPILFQR
jgi:hypothetical protein